MNVHESEKIAHLDDLRRAFDGTFAAPPRADTVAQEDLLAVNIGGDAYGMRVSEIGGLYADRKITWLPGSVPQLLGLVSLRGVILPVYDLRALLGYPKRAFPRWLVVVAGTQVVLGFDRFDRHVRVPRGVITRDRTASAGRLLVHEVALTEDGVTPIIHLPSVLEAVAVLAHQAARPKE